MEKPILKRGWLGGLEELRISSPFGPRKRPTAGASVYHRGIDIVVPVGTEIKAPFSGTLICRGINPTAGLYCVLRSGGLELRFLHLSSCILGERGGASTGVSEGQTIGRTGGARGDRKSGTSTGPHLHFEYRWSSSGSWSSSDALNPARFMSEKLIGSINRSTLSYGVPIKVDKKTGKKIEYRVGDGEKMKDSSYSQADLDNDNIHNSAYETDDSATEYYDDETMEDKNISVNEKYAKGIWQIVKLAMDSSVQDLLVFDATVSIQTGSILGFFNKACQQPLVEFSGDTYGDQYFLTVRRPPFDKQHMMNALAVQGIFDIDLANLEYALEKMKKEGDDNQFYWSNDKDLKENLKNLSRWCNQYGYGSTYLSKLEKLENEIRSKKETQEIHKDVYTITSDDIINSNISFNENNIYSWYQFYPQFECSGDDMQYLVPAILFPEYATIWGSRALQIQSQYASFKGMGVRDKLKNDDKSESGDKRCRTVLMDLHYLIESNAYAPFVRKGTLTIKGTRKIKRGMFIQVCLEGDIEEVFFVENVSQNLSVMNSGVQRTTTLQLSHGMVKQYLKDVEINGKKISYFSLIDFTGYEENKNQINLGNWREVISKWKVNQDAFKFFLQRNQFVVNQK